MTDWGKFDILVSALGRVEAQLHLPTYLFTISGSLYGHCLISYFRA